MAWLEDERKGAGKERLGRKTIHGESVSMEVGKEGKTEGRKEREGENECH